MLDDINQDYQYKFLGESRIGTFDRRQPSGLRSFHGGTLGAISGSRLEVEVPLKKFGDTITN
jgi:hypothetical protein